MDLDPAARMQETLDGSVVDVPALWEDSCQAGLGSEAGQGLFGNPGQASEHEFHRVMPDLGWSTVQRQGYYFFHSE